MGILDYFRSVPTWSPEEVRETLESAAPDDVALIDVRQPVEYAKGHLPGALLIPVAELVDRLDELDKRTLTVVYCASGLRSRAAVGVLRRARLRRVYNMRGGIRAWEGHLAGGVPQTGMTWFPRTTQPEELVALAWVLEEGARRFYSVVAKVLVDRGVAAIFRGIAKEERKHQRIIADLHERLFVTFGSGSFPHSVLDTDELEQVMEGGMRIEEAIEWARQGSPVEVLQLAVSLETGAYDLSLEMARQMTDESAARVFSRIAREEKDHLKRLSDQLDKSH